MRQDDKESKPRVKKARPKYRSTELKALQRKWYMKLKEEGFNDIEIPERLFGKIEDTPYLHGGSCSIINRRRIIGTEGTIDFMHTRYEKIHSLAIYIENNKNINALEYFIGSNYAEGLSIRKIIKKFNSIACPYPRKKRSPNSYSVYKIFSVLRKLWNDSSLYNYKQSTQDKEDTND